MRRTAAKLAFIAGAVATLAACSGSTPTRFYMLSSVADPAPLGASSTVSTLVIALGPVSVPSYVDRPQIVTRESANAVQLGTFDHWAGALEDMIPRVLADDLAARLPGDRIVSFPRAVAPTFDYRVAVDLGRFDVNSEGEAVIAASWQIYGPADRKALTIRETTVQTQAMGQSYEQRVAALSRGLGDLSNAIAQDVAQLPREGR
ncbi:MAG TPA: PqiC family protein [Candidatus Bathyarchaeia archaeon]|nr:PqiC family protein [Candidatus Bathyarchaeia archaeon]